MLVRMAEAAAQRDRYDEADQALAGAIGDFLGSGRRLEAGSAMVRRSWVLRGRGETARSGDLLIEAVKLLERERAGPELATAYANLALLDLIAGRPKEAFAWSNKVLRSGEVPEEANVWAHSARGAARIADGDPGGLDDSHLALELALASGHGWLAIVAYGNLAADQWAIEGPAAALQSCEAGHTLAEQRGMASQLINEEILNPLFDTGEWGRLRRIVDDLIEQVKSGSGHSYSGELADWHRIRTGLYEGGLLPSADRVEGKLATAREIGDPQFLVPALVIAAMVEVRRNSAAAALELLRELDQAVDAHDFFRLSFLAEVVRVCATASDLALGHELLSAAEARLPRHQHSVVTGGAVLAEARGEFEDAARLYGDAEQRWATYGSVPERGLALLGLGRSLLQLGRPGAGSKLGEAREVFASLGARRLLEETETSLHQASA